jgi:hypothetical protein
MPAVSHGFVFIVLSPIQVKNNYNYRQAPGKLRFIVIVIVDYSTTSLRGRVSTSLLSQELF